MDDLIPVIGLEIHLQPTTASKMFCACQADTFSKKPNTAVCPVCLGLPGSLPTLNKVALKQALRLSFLLKCKIQDQLVFDRKHYYYPDLPKGYQITQHQFPLGFDGFAEVGNTKVRLRRVHLEEDTARLIHTAAESLIDFNRAGTPLIEIVTEPDFRSGSEAEEFLRFLYRLVTEHQISKANMERGTMRLEPNISLSSASLLAEGQLPSYKVEVKNINSFKFARAAIDFEIERQRQLLAAGTTPLQETRGWDEKKKETVTQRVKEELQDYRYFTEPDLPPVRLSAEFITNATSETKSPLGVTTATLESEWQVTAEEARILLQHPDMEKYIRDALSPAFPASKIAKIVINRPKIMHEVPASGLAGFLEAQSSSIITDRAQIRALVTQVIRENPAAVGQFQAGKESSLMYLLGQVQRHSGGQVDPKFALEILREEIVNG